ncbi:hypothetical protein E2562_031877 [Oryza meyeriana var. granulata]|uniref:Uncharacterized protein n=1 Tax=Oryza meyeriana var. granulata TaxID=110450 RepID=A0A6G1F029_9ORYZ|nr:hypothetical protein E2562_031877 [Oryza meyeriana var. granulata]
MVVEMAESRSGGAVAGRLSRRSAVLWVICQDDNADATRRVPGPIRPSSSICSSAVPIMHEDCT